MSELLRTIDRITEGATQSFLKVLLVVVLFIIALSFVAIFPLKAVLLFGIALTLYALIKKDENQTIRMICLTCGLGLTLFSIVSLYYPPSAQIFLQILRKLQIIGR